jgi:ferredoxin-like protein FixX
LGSLFEPRREQNLYANPKRTAKSFAHHIDIDAPEMQMVQKKTKMFCPAKCAIFEAI